MTGAPIRLDWTPPGAVSAAFMASRLPVQFLNGPIGSGKTTTCLSKALVLAAGQTVSRTRRARDAKGALAPVRRFKVCVVRDTYRQLWRSTMATWFARVPREVGQFAGAENAPATHRINFGLPDGSIVDFHADFVAIGDNSVEEVLKGYEPTMFYLNEGDELAEDVFVYASGRTGRFPPLEDGGSAWHGIVVDCNAPVLSSWVYSKVFRVPPAELEARGIALFRMPGGRSPQAENRQNLPPDYYDRQAAINADRPDYVARMIDNIPGYSRDGKPVYAAEFEDGRHVSPVDLPFLPGIKLQIGLDAGLNPAAVFGQRMASGQIRVLDELIGETGTGAKRFGLMLARRLQDRFPEAREIIGWADPSAAYGADRKAGEKSWIDIIAVETGVRIQPAPTNKLIPRLEAVRLPLQRSVDRAPGLLLSPRCTGLREGFNATYRYRKINPNEERYAEEPEKGPASHVHDALQYLCSGSGEHEAVFERKEQRARATRHAEHVHDWDPFSRGAA